MTQTLSAIVDAKLKAEAETLTKALQVDARKAGWPKNLAASLTVLATSEGISVTYPEDVAEDVENLEYGSTKAPAAPLLRLFADNHYVDIQNVLVDASLDYLFDSGEFL